jgi:hypothetical protein
MRHVRQAVWSLEPKPNARESMLGWFRAWAAMSKFWYFLLAAWIVVLAYYLSNAFERITKIEKRVDELEEKNKK